MLTCIALGSLACDVQSQRSLSKSVFPSPQRVERILSSSPSPQPARATRVLVDSWELTGPLAQGPDDAQLTGQSRSERITLDLARARPGLEAHRALLCVARETGAFLAIHHALPGAELSRFINQRCGWTSPEVSLVYWELRGSVAERELMPWLRREINNLDDSNTVSIGLALNSNVPNPYLVAAWGSETLKIDEARVSTGSAGSTAVIEGEGLSAHEVHAFVTNGAHGARSCSAPVSRGPHRFVLYCPLNLREQSATIDIIEIDPRLETPAGIHSSIWLEFGTPRSQTFRPRWAGRPQSPASLIEQLDRLRASVRAPPLEHAHDASEVLHRIHPYFVEAVHEGRKQDAATLRRRALAGTELSRWVSSGSLIEFPGGSSSSAPGSALAVGLGSPFHRAQLLDPRWDTIAISTSGEGLNSRVMIATWDTMGSAHLTQLEDSYVTQIRDERMGRTEVNRLPAAFHPVLDAAGAELVRSRSLVRTEDYVYTRLSEISPGDTVSPRQLEVLIYPASEESSYLEDVIPLKGSVEFEAHKHFVPFVHSAWGQWWWIALASTLLPPERRIPGEGIFMDPPTIYEGANYDW